ncbi:DUF542 domain-containing protein [Cyclobacterium qasimii]|uniref:Nitric oxide-dependent regulator DnrN or NorA n=2 Tax=Cyclobacterium qasimii TaxID=1350429 RepID=S7V4Q6_9BACT|nr:DUF542 domain-containing protein [Cyclobacterium qasimii]EPR65065.1 hypothetical protein ADICYQ_5994 [Cyclobacterium qasimii M12-11B]GEO20830.1 hypothetical protein CQA01_13640 [Cyclobacterium qasimii]
MEKGIDQSVGEIVAANFKTAKIFTNQGIDFCCGGNMGIADACQKKGVNLDKLLQELNEVNAGNISDQYANLTAVE